MSRERQDGYGLLSQQRTAEAQAAGVLDTEIVPVTATMSVTDKATGKPSARTVTLSKDEGNRPETSADGLASLKPVLDGGVITAGNAYPLSDGASAVPGPEAGSAAHQGLHPPG